MEKLKNAIKLSFDQVEETIKVGQKKLTGCPKFLAEINKSMIDGQLDIMANKIISKIKEHCSNGNLTPEDANEIILFSLQQIKELKKQNNSWEG